MLYVVVLRYIRPMEEVQLHLDSHRDWLVTHMKAGCIVVAGPMPSRDGGLLLAQSEDRAELDAVLAQDSFHVHRVVEYDIHAFEPALRAASFPANWALEAKAL
ncbi:uncharacterized protein YciI [Paraburkholderia sp. BL18I3N2]|uniref:YciI family protein n=1 Tax=Paraburkholderia sp. BL18I3N2 TaxID=1938799 RepID=UPI000D06FE2A|nr:YciI family protein [Paraburkholderia sp. BL18I3N2]PRX27320.1 uncharacterized protein YciI [Paraburkholderia sp. BL18I3N2]